MTERAEAVKEALDDLGLSEEPAQRWETTPGIPDLGGLVQFKKALSCIDPLDTAAFEHYIPDSVVIDQAIDTRAYVRGWSRAIVIPTDVPIPTGPMVTRSTGIYSEPTAPNHYRWLALEVKRHFDELGARAIGPPLIFRTSGYGGTRPLLGVIMKLDLTPPDGQDWQPAANWGMLHNQRDPTAEEKKQWQGGLKSSTV
jgi:hypothetical protein